MISPAIQHFSAALQQALAQLHTAAAQQPGALTQLQATHAVTLTELAQALQQFSAILQRTESHAGLAELSPEDAEQLGSQGLQLLYTLEDWSKTLKLSPLAAQAAILMLVAWIGRHQGSLEAQEAVVNCLAECANQTQDTALLKGLCQIVPDIIATAPFFIKQDWEKMNPARPWRLLHFNYAIIATRSHDTALMDAAFQRLVTQFPQEAKAFFAEGMRQMDVVGYPPPVREIMQRYYTLCSAPASLH